MGGSGGYSGYKAVSTSPPIGTSIDGTQSSQREIEINEFLEDLLKDINNRDAEAIRTHINEITKVLANEIDGIETILFGGSLSKNTFVEGASDVDALVFLDKAIYNNISPQELQKRFLTLLKNRFPRTEISVGKLAVTVKFSDYEIQLLPALRDSKKIQIPNNEKHGWSAPIDIHRFTQKLTLVNKMNGNKVVPVIKIVKKLFEKLPEKYQLSGYHIESMAVEFFSAYSGRNTLYDMTKYYLDSSVKRILRPISDITGQSKIIDEDLGPTNNMNRQTISHFIKDIAGRFSGSDAVSVTKELFGGAE